MIVRREHKVLVQGMTGKQGSFWTAKMIGCGTRVIGGVNPRRRGETHLGLPVFGSAAEAMDAEAYDVSVMFIPPAAAKAAAIDAIDAGVKLLVILTEHIPLHDVMAIHAAAARGNTRIIGPNTAGVVTPGEASVGIMPGHNPNIFRPGQIGVISRSGSLGTLVCLNLTRAGMGQSAFLGIGGDPIVGTTTREAVSILNDDPGTRAVALVGEIGGAMEEDAAATIAGMDKPVVCFIAGRASPPGKKMGHAGAIVACDRGSYHSKRTALEAAGASVVDTPGELAGRLQARLADAVHLALR
jgi:succinyl-CoA synthetase alpha subunit